MKIDAAIYYGYGYARTLANLVCRGDIKGSKMPLGATDVVAAHAGGRCECQAHDYVDGVPDRNHRFSPMAGPGSISELTDSGIMTGGTPSRVAQ
ncbi:hypothetical protein [Asanoa iriomotensis]|uniref:Uncharacterized protein n=1 Tax=Asanoa iriomotensis TaxID=234613 RepID=A0ABQ4CC59_9ACTN|nr:hypothetical protein [Asanoa iriomotensis]GIF60345.1 hypothetical protein Air01nite_64400 [Asanoa iriomotensis]